jgi:hypothetical protein
MAENTDNILYINDVEYNTDEFSQDQKYLVAQIKSCQDRVSRAKFDFDRESAALNTFTSSLIASLEANKEAKAS